jgi:methyl-accepting chemotaxis protein
VNSTKRIQGTLLSFKEATPQMGTSIERIASIIQEQAESSEQMSAVIDEIQGMSGKLNEFAKKL